MLTLIGESMAKKGMKFIFEGADNENCVKCKLRFTCSTNLEKGRVYEVIDVKKTKHYCPKEDAYVQLVEIVEPTLEMAVASRRAIEGMTFEYEPPCSRARCRYRDECVPPGVARGEKVRITRILGPLECPEGPKKRVEIVRI
ncbi:UPF0179 family protein [archaeon]|nr:MAG: UPF0179 family protein [archaeon]